MRALVAARDGIEAHAAVAVIERARAGVQRPHRPDGSELVVAFARPRRARDYVEAHAQRSFSAAAAAPQRFHGRAVDLVRPVGVTPAANVGLLHGLPSAKRAARLRRVRLLLRAEGVIRLRRRPPVARRPRTDVVVRQHGRVGGLCQLGRRGERHAAGAPRVVDDRLGIGGVLVDPRADARRRRVRRRAGVRGEVRRAVVHAQWRVEELQRRLLEAHFADEARADSSLTRWGGGPSPSENPEARRPRG
mmetsp:Transcript_11964/g.41348  ORF Transcript_11964/g.41348 Transcript_11964/m.41348 type:complete len:248 (-) Transcript_11964:94-837(-)